jgi:ABC-type dipeptide/oligopeptide/nickel transport system permease subunit
MQSTQDIVAVVAPARGIRLSARVLRLARRQPLGAVAAILIVSVVMIAVFADAVAPYDPNASVGVGLLAPGEQGFILGTDFLGRDVLSRIIHGARISLRVGIIAVAIGTLGGTIVGTVSGYFGGKADLAIQRVVDGVQAFPALILLISLISVVGASTNNAMMAIGVLLIAGTSRVVRGAVLTVKQLAYVEAARVLGASNVRIMLQHVLPNVMAPVIVLASIALGEAIIIEAGLSFLGLGTQPPTASWGQMLSGDGRQYMFTRPGLAIFPGLAIAVTVLAFNLLGDSIRDVLDPKLRTRAA